LVWARALADIDASPILHGGRLYVGTNSGEVHALDPATGADLWTSPFEAGNGAVKGYVWPRPGTNEILFATTDTLWSITDNGTGAVLDWSVSSIPNPSVPLVSNLGGGSYVWVGSSDGRIYQLEISAAPAMTWVVLGDGTASVGSPAMDAAAEIAYVGTENGRLYSVTLPLP
jgi:outer membrane protein assembly factor BamB